MSHQERTWVETTDEATGNPRWDVLINGMPVPGGYVVQTGSGAFEAHYPHVVTFIKETLAAAQERLAWAPPLTRGVAAIANPADDNAGEFTTPNEAARKLGVSVYRINAMVANGKLAARRCADGTPEIALSSLCALAAQTTQPRA